MELRFYALQQVLTGNFLVKDIDTEQVFVFLSVPIESAYVFDSMSSIDNKLSANFEREFILKRIGVE
jgi:hypothetical protein